MADNTRKLRASAAFLFDLVAAAAVWMISYLLRFNGELPSVYVTAATHQLVWVLPIYAFMFRAFGLYRGMWLFASLPDLIRIGKGVLAGSLLIMIASVLIQPLPLVPRSVLIVSPIMLLLIMGGARALYRASKEFYTDRRHREQGVDQRKPVLIIGAGRAGATLTRELARSSDWRLLGLLDDDGTKIGREIYGYRVLGSIDKINQLTSTDGDANTASHVIIAIPGATASEKRRVAELCMRSPARVMLLPQLTDAAEADNFLSRVRNIDLEDLLGRDAVQIESEHVAELLRDRIVMVTGAGGSIGSELCRQIAEFAPACLLVYEMSEFAMYKLGEEFRERYPAMPLLQIIGDVKDALLLDKVMAQHQPHIVFHAAAYKHVPLMEDTNAWQAVRNNVYGTYQVATAAIKAGASHFVLISTDKAVNPTNVMGASKRLAEMVCQALQQPETVASDAWTSMAAGGDVSTMPASRVTRTRFETVRFGNVLGSAGSVIPKFQEQIAKGGPVTVTHPDITRFFMTIPEASQLVLQASSMGRGGEIFVLDMGRPMKIVDLARDLIRLYGYNEQQIRIEYTGLRPGEKLYEELLANDEETRPTHHAKLMIARTRTVPDDLLPSVLAWLTEPHVPDDDEVRRRLQGWVEEYAPMRIDPRGAPETGTAMPIAV